MASALALAGEDSKRRLPRKVQANEQREEMAQTMPRGMALMGPARPARGELRQPKRKTATPRMPEAAPAPTVWELMPRVKLAVMVSPWVLTSAKSEAAKAYGVMSIPSNVLLNPEGKIIATDLRGEELQQVLADLFE